ncbi:MAG: acetyl ornithine aminotransferase family protein [Nitrososphaerota archaeon]|nr:acetyl ornithine aminotransferase family protein [Candidatus Bathyarchaeota archaeon]MDW8193310.1 acetyl ornithine aminotransferase family protein [Nitrososphaerota archaeon]
MGANIYPRIIVSPPGPNAREIVKRDVSVVSPSYSRFYPLVIKAGKGCIVIDVDGNEYIDFNSGYLCLNVGHCHPNVTSAIKKQCDLFLHYSASKFYYEELVTLAERLTEISPIKSGNKISFCNSGSETIETAIKLMRWHTRKPLFIGFINAFHGSIGMGALAFTSNMPVQRRYFSPFMPGVINVPYPYCYRCPFKQTYPSCHYWCVDFIEEFVLQKYAPPEDVAAILFETIQSEGGLIVPPPEYFQRLKKLADKYGLLLVDDEIKTGVGRTGKWFAIEHWNVEPDVLCTADSLASGLPLGAVITKEKVMDWVGGSHSSTVGGNPVACAAALAVIDVIREERLLENATKQGTYIMKRLEELRESCTVVGDIRGKGLMLGIEIVNAYENNKPSKEKAHEIIIRSWKHGVILSYCGASTVVIAPPLNISRDLVDSAMDIVENVVKDVEKEDKA